MKVAESECPDLSGGWSNSGTVSYKHSQWSPLLSYHLTGSRATPVGLRITPQQDQLLIQFDVNADGSAKPTELRRGEDYKCEEGALWQTQSHVCCRWDWRLSGNQDAGIQENHRRQSHRRGTLEFGRGSSLGHSRGWLPNVLVPMAALFK